MVYKSIVILVVNFSKKFFQSKVFLSKSFFSQGFVSLYSNKRFSFKSLQTKRFKLVGIASLIGFIMLPSYSTATECIFTPGGSESCVKVTLNPASSVKLNTTKTESDKWTITPNTNKFSNSSDTIQIQANKAIIQGWSFTADEVFANLSKEKGFAFQKGAGFTSSDTPEFNILQDSVLVLPVLMFSAETHKPYRSSEQRKNRLTFRGHYQGSSTAETVSSVNGYALVVSNQLISQLGYNKFNFIDQADVKVTKLIIKKTADDDTFTAILPTAQDRASPDYNGYNGLTTELNFKNSSFEGDIVFGNPNNFENNNKHQLFLNFDGVGGIKDTTSDSYFSYKGNIGGGMNVAKISFKDGKLIGNISNMSTETIKAVETTFYTQYGTYTFDNTTMTGNITLQGKNTQTLNFINNKIEHNKTNRMHELVTLDTKDVAPQGVDGDGTQNLPKSTYGKIFSSLSNLSTDIATITSQAASLYKPTMITVGNDTNFTLNIMDSDIDLKNFKLYAIPGHDDDPTVTGTRRYRLYDSVVDSHALLSSVGGAKVVLEGDEVILLNTKNTSNTAIVDTAYLQDIYIDTTSSMHINLKNAYIAKSIISAGKLTFTGKNVVVEGAIKNLNPHSYISLGGLTAQTIESDGLVGNGNFLDKIDAITLDGATASIDAITLKNGNATNLTLKNGAKLGMIPVYHADSDQWIGQDNGEKNFVVQGTGTLTLNLEANQALTKNIFDTSTAALKLNFIEKNSTQDIVLNNPNSELTSSKQIASQNIGDIYFGGKKLTMSLRDTSIGNVTIANGQANMTVSDTIFADKKFSTSGGQLDLTLIYTTLIGTLYASQGGISKATLNGMSSGITSAGTTALTGSFADQKKRTPNGLLTSTYSKGINIFQGDIVTNNATQQVIFNNVVHLGGAIVTQGGTTKVSMNFQKDFIKNQLAKDTPLQNLAGGPGTLFEVSTLSGTSSLAIEGDIKGIANITYAGGETNLILADKQTSSAMADETNLNEYAGGNNLYFNGYSYTNGVLIRLQSDLANTVLKPFRKRFPNNNAVFAIDKLSNSAENLYVAHIKGIMVGEIDSLKSEVASGETPKRYEAILEDQAVFIGKLNITNDMSIKFQTGSKLILHSDSTLNSLSSDGAIISNQEGLDVNTLSQKNAVVDLVAGKNESTTYSKLTINKIENLSNTLFRVSYDGNADSSSPQANKNDHIIVKEVSTKQGVLNNYLQVYQRSHLINPGEDLLKKKILVASVKNDSSGVPLLVFNTSSFFEGYDETTAALEKVVEANSEGGGGVSEGSSESWTNYYVKSSITHIQSAALSSAQSALISNYSIFLSNINNINRRLGELRFNPLSQGAWARIYNSMSTVNRGEEVSISSINVQGGYDYSLAHNESKSILGVALAYGRNSQNSQSFDAKANLFEIGAYYSWIEESGLYSDSILKYSFIGNTISMKEDDINKNLPLNSSIVSIGEEIGYRWAFLLKEGTQSKHGLYFEPQVEFILGYLSGSSFEEKNLEGDTLNSSISSILAFRSRVGGVMGYSIKSLKNQTDVRMGLSYVGDFGSTHMDFQTKRSQASLPLDSNHMAMLSFGVNSIINVNWRVYADVETGFAGKYYNQTYLVSLGGRYAFGKANPIKQQRNQQQQTQNTLAQGYYWEVYSIPDTMQLSKEQVGLLQKYPHAIERSYRDVKDASGKVRKVLYRTYYLGGFKTQEGASKNQKIADDVASILYNKASKALLRQVK